MDGRGWTDDVETDGVRSTDSVDAAYAQVSAAPPSRAQGISASGAAPVAPKSHKVRNWALAAVALLILIAILVPSSDTETKSPSTAASTTGAADPSSAAADATTTGSSSTAAAPAPAADDNCGSKASDDCTPSLGPSGTVRVDALEWSVASVRTAATIGDKTYGLGSKADGRYVLVKLKVHSDKNESADLLGDNVKLVIGDNSYDEDSTGSTALIGTGAKGFVFETIGPDSTKTGTLVFDVPANVIHDKLKMRFNELGFGDTHGFIALPGL